MLPLESSVGQGQDIGAGQLLTRQQTRQKDIESAYRVMKDTAGKAEDRRVFEVCQEKHRTRQYWKPMAFNFGPASSDPFRGLIVGVH